MQRLAGIMLVAALAAAALAGCALRDPRVDYAYSRASDGLWGDAPFELIDWNFPTSLNQPPIDVPKRIRLEKTAIGVTWATRNPLPLSDNLAPYDAPPESAVKADDGTMSNASSQPRTRTAGTAVVDERRGTR